jgi:hypothetical protein
MDDSVDVLATVSRVMFDQRILDLRKENDALQCEVALLRFGPEAINRKLAEANDTGLTEICTCQACFTAKRFCDEDDPKELVTRFDFEENKPLCILKECLLWHADRLGLTYQIQVEQLHSDSDGEQQENCNRDCDLVIIEDNFLWTLEYGKRLSLENFHKNPSFPELQSLFTLMDEGDEFYQVNGKDYRVIAEDAV